MPTQIAIAHSQSSNAQEAVYQACIGIRNQLEQSPIHLVIVFACIPFATTETLEVIHSVLKPQKLVGSSASGIILSDTTLDQGIGLLAIHSDEIGFGLTQTNISAEVDMRSAGFDWSKRLQADFHAGQHHACVMFSSANLFYQPKFLTGVQEVLGLSVPIIGGVSSDNFKLKNSCQMVQKQLLKQSAVGLLIGGNMVAIGNKHGFKPLGKPRTITKAYDNVIQMIDDNPAISIYQDYLGPEAERLTKTPFNTLTTLYPLGLYMEEHGQYLLKNAVDILPDGSIVCLSDVRQGAEVHLMIGNRDTCRDSAAKAAQQVKDALGGRQAKLLLIIESAARQKILKNHAMAEIQAIKDVLGYTTPIFGMYSYGEIIPITQNYGANNSFVQNGSIVILAVN